MVSYKYIYVIYNPKSTGKSEGIARAFAAQAKKALPGSVVEVHGSQYAGHVHKLVPKLLGHKRQVLFVSSSGDGGYHELINAVMSSKGWLQFVDCAVLPGGNANDHSRTMHRGNLIESFPNVERTKLDLLKIKIAGTKGVKTYYAHSNAGLGLAPEAAKEINKHDFNPFREVKLVLQAFRRLKPFKIRVNRKVLTLDSLMFVNIYQMAKVLTMSDKNRPRDGKFEIHIFRHRHKSLLLFKLIKAVILSVRPEKRVRRYKFETLHDTPIQLDGEVIELEKGTQVTVTVAYRALRTII